MKTEERIASASSLLRRRYRIPLIVALIVVVTTAILVTANVRGDRGVAVATCPGDDLACQQDQVFGPNDPCRFVRITDAERVLGAASGEVPGRTVDKCFLAKFSVRVLTQGGATEYQTEVKGLRTERFALGDQAVWDSAVRVLHVLVGDAYLAIVVPEVDGAREKAIAIAGLVLPKIAPKPSADA
jgi:hypothetical protein